MKKEDLYKIGFKGLNSKSNLLNYYLIQEENNEVFLQICISNTNIYPTLIVNQYDWSEMQGNITYLPMINIKDILSLKSEIKTLKRLFV